MAERTSGCEKQWVRVAKVTAASLRVAESVASRNEKTNLHTLMSSPLHELPSVLEYTSIILPITSNHEGRRATSVFSGGELMTAFRRSEVEVSMLRGIAGSSGTDSRSDRTPYADCDR